MVSSQLLQNSFKNRRGRGSKSVKKPTVDETPDDTEIQNKSAATTPDPGTTPSQTAEPRIRRGVLSPSDSDLRQRGSDTGTPDRTQEADSGTNTAPPSSPKDNNWKKVRGPGGGKRLRRRPAPAAERTQTEEAHQWDSWLGAFTLQEDTLAPAGHAATPEEAEKEGCVSTDPVVEGADECSSIEIEPPKKTEAELEAFSSCEECNDPLNKGLATVSGKEKDNILKNLEKFLNAVAHGIKGLGPWAESGSIKRIVCKINRGGSICSPQTALSKIIKNFNDTCNETFDKFFPKAYCESCQKGIPAEIMFAMMSIESAGECNAINEDEDDGKKKENSRGLFQINIISDEYEECQKPASMSDNDFLLNPHLNFKCGMTMLNNHYNEVNPKRDTSPSCGENYKHWKDLKKKKTDSVHPRDQWRRAVSGYNSGGGWINRAVQSVEGPQGSSRGRDFSRDTKDLYGSTHKLPDRAKKSKVSWEDLRVYYFIEKLLPENKPEDHIDKKKSGRDLGNTISNIAHTEAVLGREADKAPKGMVEYWSEYIRQYRDKYKEKHRTEPCSKRK